jgi:hypothetical protein
MIAPIKADVKPLRVGLVSQVHGPGRVDSRGLFENRLLRLTFVG